MKERVRDQSTSPPTRTSDELVLSESFERAIESSRTAVRKNVRSEATKNKIVDGLQHSFPSLGRRQPRVTIHLALLASVMTVAYSVE